MAGIAPYRPAARIETSTIITFATAHAAATIDAVIARRSAPGIICAGSTRDACGCGASPGLFALGAGGGTQRRRRAVPASQWGSLYQPWRRRCTRAQRRWDNPSGLTNTCREHPHPEPRHRRCCLFRRPSDPALFAIGTVGLIYHGPRRVGSRRGRLQSAPAPGDAPGATLTVRDAGRLGVVSERRAPR